LQLEFKWGEKKLLWVHEYCIHSQQPSCLRLLEWRNRFYALFSKCLRTSEGHSSNGFSFL
jgi:hypothetical protein